MPQGPKNSGSTESEQFEAFINQLYWELPKEEEPEDQKEQGEDD